jgi:hypothetical protein
LFAFLHRKVMADVEKLGWFCTKIVQDSCAYSIDARLWQTWKETTNKVWADLFAFLRRKVMADVEKLGWFCTKIVQDSCEFD